MVLRKITACSCSLSLSLNLLPSLLFLYSILPSSSYGQVTDPSNISTTTIRSSSPPSTLQTSTTPSPTSTPPPSSTQTQDNASSPTPTNGSTGNGRTTGTFNFYFVIVAIVIIIFILLMLYLGKRKKQKAALMRRHSQRALAEDMEGLRNRFGMGRGGMRRAHAGGSAGSGNCEQRIEGLDEDGEAPPPYDRIGSKPPSIGGGDGVDVRELRREETRGGEGVEMNTMGSESAFRSRDRYADARGNAGWGDLDMQRPAPAVTAPPRRDGLTG